MSGNAYEERWQSAPDFVVAGVHVPAVTCPRCERRLVDAARSRTLHASVTCPSVYTVKEVVKWE